MRALKWAGLLGVLLFAACGKGPDEAFYEGPTNYRAVEESAYNRVIVDRKGDVAEMRFRSGRRGVRQSAVDLTNPKNLLLPYSKTILVAAAVQPEPRKILQIGLGGGALNRFLAEVFPEASMTTVEIDGKVLQMAREHMGLREMENHEVVLEDGRAFLRKAKERWDWILVDAFHGDSPPEHLKTKEFYELLRSRLKEGGVAVFNLISGNRLHESDLATLRAVFPEMQCFAVVGTRNVVVLTGAPRVDGGALREEVREALVERVGYEIAKDAVVLRDDYVPAQFLNGQPTRQLKQGE